MMRDRLCPLLCAPLLTVLLLALCAGSPGRMMAQTTQTGILQGRVTARDGHPLANATIALRQADGSYPRRVVADDRGEFRINFITPGVYVASVRLVGYRPQDIDSVRVRATESTRLDVSLDAAPTELATVNVTASEVAINKTTTEYTSAMPVRERELLPTARTANALIAFTPGARPDQVFGGSTTQANLYQLDGVTMNQPGTGGSFLLPNVDWLEDIRVIGLGAGAEYGNFQGGLINMVTKSGTNTLQGAVRTFVESRAMNATNVNAFENGSELDSRREFNAEVRGPIKRDRLYYFISGQESFADTRVVDFRSGSVSDAAFLSTLAGRHEQKYYAKLTWQASTRDIVNGSIGLDNLYRERVGLNGYDDVAATYRGSSPSTFYQANWQRTFTSRDFLEVKFSGYLGHDDELPYNGALPSVQLLDVAGSPQYGNAPFTRRNSPTSNSLTANFDRYFNTGRVEHNLKVGAEYGLGGWRERRTRNGGLSWYTQPKSGVVFNPRDVSTWTVIPSVGSGIYATADTGGGIDLDALSRNAALYAQDYMRLSNRVAVGAGIRLSNWAGYITPGNGGSSKGTAQFKALGASGLDPRLGITVDLTGRGDLVAKAHWGRYHQNLFALFFDRAPGANVFSNVGFCDWSDTQRQSLPDPSHAYTSAEIAQLFTCTPGRTLFNEARAYEGYKQPYMDQVTLGLEKSIGSHIKAQLLYVNRVNKAVLSLVDKNLAMNWKPIKNVHVYDGFGAVPGPDGKPLVLPVVYVRADDLRARVNFGFGDPIPGYTRNDTLTLPATIVQDLVIKPVDGAKRTFDQVQAVVNGVYSRFSFNAAIAWTNLQGNVFSVNGYFNPNGQENGPFVEPNGQINYDGRLENFAPWDLKVRITGKMPWKFEGGAYLNFISGDFWTPTYTMARSPNYTALNAQGQEVVLPRELFTHVSGQQVFVEPRGSRQLEYQGSLDLRIQRPFRVKSTDLLVGLELFNSGNANAATDIKTSLNNQSKGDPSSLVGAVRLRQQPTTIRLNTQIRF